VVNKLSKSKSQKSLILLNDVSEAIKAEQILKAVKLETKMVAPPAEIRIGCDLAVEIDLLDSFEAKKILEAHKIKPIKIIFLANTQLEPTEIVKKVDFNDYLMIKAGHMKLTFNKETGEIVNISGGGCSDIPFLALRMVGNTLEKTEKPEELGCTLCAYMLKKAYQEAIRIYRKA
jgi:hypothetical protein